MYQMYCESLGGNSVVSQLALMSARCLGRRDLPTLLAYYPYYCILPLPPTPTSYYPYYPYLLPLPTTLTTLTTPTPPTTNPSNTPRTGYRLLSLPPHLLPPTTLTTPYVQYPYYPCYLLLLLCYPYYPYYPSERFMYRVCIPYVLPLPTPPSYYPMPD